MSKHYRFEKADSLCEHFNNFIHTLKKEREQDKSKENYPWLDPSDERKYITDKQILEKYIDLDKSRLTEKEKKEVMGMLYKYKEAFNRYMSQYRNRDRCDGQIPILYQALPCQRGR